MAEITTKLFYGQKVYLALAKCACSESIHDVSYTKVGAGYVRKYIEESDSYMVEVTNSGTSTVSSYCPCSTYDVGTDSSKKDMKEIAHNHIFVMGLTDRSVKVGEDEIKVDDILNVYPYSDKYKVIAFSSDMALILACNVNGIASSGALAEDQMVIIDLNDTSTFITIGDGTPVIPYTYTVLDETTEDAPVEDEG